jgi:hypothetical protein
VRRTRPRDAIIVGTAGAIAVITANSPPHL